MTGIVTFTPNPALDVSTSVAQIVPTHKMRCTVPRLDPGGGGINVARVVHRLGGEVTAVYPCGGLTGQLLSRLLVRDHVDIETPEIAEETRQDFAVYEEKSGQQFRFVLPGPSVAEHEWHTCLNTIAAFANRAGFVVASGSLPPGTPPELYARTCRTVKAGQGKFLLDTSGAALKAALAEGVYLIKPSLRELCEALGENLEDEAACIRACVSLVKSRQAEIVALTLGDRGAMLVARDRVILAEPPPQTPVSSVGAGDSFLGAMVFALAAGHDLADALRLGVAAGSSAVLNPGTELAHADDTRRLADVVTVREL